jgi:hypothetical protein
VENIFELNKEIEKLIKEILKYQKNEIEPEFFKGKVKVRKKYNFDQRLWLHYQGVLDKEEKFVFEFRCFKQKVKTHAVFYKNGTPIFITEEEDDLGSLFDTIKKEMKRYSFSELYSK